MKEFVPGAKLSVMKQLLKDVVEATNNGDKIKVRNRMVSEGVGLGWVGMGWKKLEKFFSR